jgi:hypothetical protein
LRRALIFAVAFALAFGATRLARAEAGMRVAAPHMQAQIEPATTKPVA